MSVSRINQNIMSMQAYRNLSVAQNSLSNNVRHFSTGLRIESAKDDATGLAISERFRSQITGYETANKNAQDANNLLQTADGALNETHSMLQRLRQLAITSANEATTDADRKNIQTEVHQLLDEIDTISKTTQYNGRTLINGDLQGSSETSNASLKVAQNVNVSNSTIQSASATSFINESTLTAAANATQDVSFEIRITAGSTAGQFDAVIYASDNFTKNADGTFKSLNVVSTISNIGAGTTTITSLTGYSSVTGITLNAVSSADVGKSVMLRLQSQVSAVTNDKALSFQVRANEGQVLNLSLGDMSSTGLRIRKLDVTNRLAGQNAIAVLDSAIGRVSTQRANIGALQQRVSSTISANETNVINQRSAESRIRDVDFAEETLSFTRNNILIQSGTTILAQANAAPQSVLSLLQG